VSVGASCCEGCFVSKNGRCLGGIITSLLPIPETVTVNQTYQDVILLVKTTIKVLYGQKFILPYEEDVP